MSSDCRRICLTPTKNEAWVIGKFLAAASRWADHIIVADQGSSDGTLDQLQSAFHIEVVLNDSPIFDERHRQRLLIDRAREITGRRILIALDADEALSANCLETEEWERIANAEPGTVLRFRWVNILPGFQKAWIPPEHVPFGFVDDGSEHQPTRIHSRRIPWPDGAPVIDLNDIVVLHFQYVAWERMASKQSWYQAWELATHREKSPLQIFREYNHMVGSWNPSEIHSMKPEWLAGYDREKLDFRSLKSEPVTWWDKEVIQMFQEYGPQFFRKLDIWKKDWNAISSSLGIASMDLTDPRSSSERVFHYLLARTQKQRMNWGVRGFERLLRYLGW